jgi:hypothetical protein
MLAIIGGRPARFAPFAALFQQALANYGRPPLPVGVHGPGHVAPTDEHAREEFWPHWRELIRLVAIERGFAIPTEESFAYEIGPQPDGGETRRTFAELSTRSNQVANWLGEQGVARRPLLPHGRRCRPR